ncbi:MAG: SAM-dependent methyltransferase [Acidimicrobiales bacterium]
MTHPTDAVNPPRPVGVSRTAVVVAQARADESTRTDRLFTDPHAQVLVAAAGRIEGLSAAGKMAGTHFVLRTRFFDDLLGAAVDTGCHQVVLVGAGLDTRAFRLHWPPGVRLFELDLPDLLAFKDQVLAEAGADPTCVRVPVPVDLRDDWPTSLEAAGYDATLPTVWLIEGVLMYLPSAAADRLMERIGQLSRPGSRLGLEHANRAYMELPMMRKAKQRLSTTDAGWQSSVEDPVGWLGGHGWRAEVTSPRDLASRHGRTLPPVVDPDQVGGAQLWLVGAER